ncbi:MAG: ATP-dependent Clp protease proteolytic subunit [Janthinobacterium lividum]
MAEATVYISGPIVSDSSEAGNVYPFCTLEDVMMQLEYQKPYDVVRVIINSPGGRVDKGMGVYDKFRSLPGVKIITEAIGQCSSIATAVFLAGSERIIHPNTESLVHLPTGGINGANAEQAQAWAEAMARSEADLLALYAERAGVDPGTFAEVMRAETKLTAQQMLDYGFATQILQPTTALAIVMPTVYTPSAEADQTPGWAQQLMSKLSMGLAAMTTALATLKAPTKAEAPEAAATTALDVTTDGGDTLTINTGDRAAYEVGDTVAGSDGNAPADADYVLTDGNTISVAAGAITAINPTETADTTASAGNDAALLQMANAITALAGQVGTMQSKLTATTNLATRAAAAVGSKATPSRASAASDQSQDADTDPGKAAGEARAARRANRYAKP